MPAFFVTGTDTGVGKTVVSAGLLHAARAAGHSTLGLKPLAAGCRQEVTGPVNDDAAALLDASSPAGLCYAQVNAVALAQPLAPQLAAAAEGRELRAAELVDACRAGLALHADLTLVEGAGGWRVPLNDQETLADVPRALALPVLLVVGLRLGCQNHALLSAEAIRADGLELAGWVACQVEPDMGEPAGNLACLARRLPAPLLATLPHLPGVTPETAAPRLLSALDFLLDG